MQVTKWGDGLAIPIPAEIAAQLHLKAGDEITVRTTSPTEFSIECKVERDVECEPVIPNKPTREELIERIRQMGVPFPPDFKFSREEANERGRY